MTPQKEPVKRKPRRRILREDVPECAFCGVPEDHCDMLVSSPFSKRRETYICENCIESALDILVATTELTEAPPNSITLH